MGRLCTIVTLAPSRNANKIRLLNDGKYKRPKAGKDDDKAHPPIHPAKYETGLTGEEKQLYELIVRHFLATCSDDAIGYQTQVTIDIAGEEFNCWGLMITDLNWLNVFKYEKWSNKDIPVFKNGETFAPTSLIMDESSTEPPRLLSEAELINKMDKSGIGTDATIAQHINTVKERGYAVCQNGHYEPTELGLALVKGYASMGLELSKPNLRAKVHK